MIVGNGLFYCSFVAFEWFLLGIGKRVVIGLENKKIAADFLFYVCKRLLKFRGTDQMELFIEITLTEKAIQGLFWG